MNSVCSQSSFSILQFSLTLLLARNANNHEINKGEINDIIAMSIECTDKLCIASLLEYLQVNHVYGSSTIDIRPITEFFQGQ